MHFENMFISQYNLAVGSTNGILRMFDTRFHRKALCKLNIGQNIRYLDMTKYVMLVNENLYSIYDYESNSLFTNRVLLSARRNSIWLD